MNKEALQRKMDQAKSPEEMLEAFYSEGLKVSTDELMKIASAFNEMLEISEEKLDELPGGIALVKNSMVTVRLCGVFVTFTREMLNMMKNT